MVSLINSHTNATSIGWHLWEIYLRFAPGVPPGWWPMVAKLRAIRLTAFFCVPVGGLQDSARKSHDEAQRAQGAVNPGKSLPLWQSGRGIRPTDFHARVSVPPAPPHSADVAAPKFLLLSVNRVSTCALRRSTLDFCLGGQRSQGMTRSGRVSRMRLQRRKKGGRGSTRTIWTRFLAPRLLSLRTCSV